jgi:hypothetical protein
VEDLREVLDEARTGGARTALITIVPVDDMPPLPDLGAIWARQPIADDVNHNASLIHDLTKAESQLSAYRAALHRRLASATAELIARYRESPDLCLTALPSQPGDRKSAAR